MTNPYFTNTIDLLEVTRARATDVESNLSAVEAGFDGVNTDMLLRAPIASPALTGAPTTTTPSTGDTSTRIANMAAVQAAIGAAAALNLPNIVGANGKALRVVAGVPAWGDLSFVNMVHNGNFAVNQRGVSGTVVLTAGSYGHDRWKAGASGCTYTFAASAGVTTLTISAGTLTQVIDGMDLRTGTYVASWSGSAQGRINGGSYGSSRTTASLTGGTNATLEFGTGTLSLVQVESGTQATAAMVRPLMLEELICQRYLPVTSAYHVPGGTIDQTSAYYNAEFQVPCRAAPTGLLLTAGLSSYQVLNSSFGYTALTAGSIAFNAASTGGAKFTVTFPGTIWSASYQPTAFGPTSSAKILWTGAEL